MRNSIVLAGLLFIMESVPLIAQLFGSLLEASSSSSTTTARAAHVKAFSAANISNTYMTSTSDYNVIF